ncbi:hypothetical protein [Candidatus Viridilinea mediisalina]|nr:hypothetical protein [Candidatus Viridilinea mediisalina]
MSIWPTGFAHAGETAQVGGGGGADADQEMALATGQGHIEIAQGYRPFLI